MNQEKIGCFIASLRKENKLTQEELAEKLLVSNRSISRWENGRSMPDLSMFQILADEFQVSVSELLKGERMSQADLVLLREHIDSIIEIADRDKTMKKNKINYYLMAGLACITLVILDQQFNILSYVFIENITEFVCGMLIGLGLLFELIGIYNNNHETSFRQRKKELLFKK